MIDLKNNQINLMKGLELKPLETYVGKKGGHGRKVKAECNYCGDIGIYHLAALKKRKYTGCNNCSKLKRLNPEKYIGNKYKNLTVEKFIKYDGSSKSVYSFKCSCGSYLEARLNNVVYGKTSSCGCVKTEYITRTYSKTSLDKAVTKIMIGMRRKKVDVSREYVKSLIVKRCSYCGDEGSNYMKTKEGVFKFNGVDRVDSTKGYEEGNCVTCCKTCNIMKSTLSVEEFYNHINKIISYNGEDGEDS